MAAAYDLIEAGIDLSTKNSDGKQAFELAKENEGRICNFDMLIRIITP